MELFYAHPENISGSAIRLDDFEARHLVKTLRKNIGDIIDITDGCGKHYSGRITSLKPNLLIEIDAINEIPSQEKKFALGIGFIRPSRLEFVMEKCTELGVTAFYLFRSEYANYFSDNRERFEKILRQAIKQSMRFYLPDLYLMADFRSFIFQSVNFGQKIVAIDPDSPPIHSVLKKLNGKNTLFCVGPEGGFSAGEIETLKENSFCGISLGKYRLRAETAAVAGISYLNLLNS